MLQGEEQLDPELEEQAGFTLEALQRPPAPIAFNANFPLKPLTSSSRTKCHRSINNLWRQVLEYFDASIIGLTATPSKQSLGFFNQNLVMEYNFEQAVADGVNVDFDLYTIRTLISEHGRRSMQASMWTFATVRLAASATPRPMRTSNTTPATLIDWLSPKTRSARSFAPSAIVFLLRFFLAELRRRRQPRAQIKRECGGQGDALLVDDARSGGRERPSRINQVRVHLLRR
jgi:hypothetical protein